MRYWIPFCAERHQNMRKLVHTPWNRCVPCQYEGAALHLCTSHSPRSQKQSQPGACPPDCGKGKCWAALEARTARPAVVASQAPGVSFPHYPSYTPVEVPIQTPWPVPFPGTAQAARSYSSRRGPSAYRSTTSSSGCWLRHVSAQVTSPAQAAVAVLVAHRRVLELTRSAYLQLSPMRPRSACRGPCGPVWPV